MSRYSYRRKGFDFGDFEITKREILARLKSGKTQFVIGTHALIQANVEFGFFQMRRGRQSSVILLKFYPTHEPKDLILPLPTTKARLVRHQEHNIF